MSDIKMGLAMCGSYCTFEKAMAAAERLCKGYDVTPIMSERAAATDTRFGKAADHIKRFEEMTGKKIISTVVAAEPIGPKKLLDVIVVAPCTGNTMAKIASGATDSSVTMAVKAHLRNGRPVVLAIATNDGLGANGKNIGELMARKNVYFVPFYQDDPMGKPNSLTSDLNLIEDTVVCALRGEQLQPVIIER